MVRRVFWGVMGKDVGNLMDVVLGRHEYLGYAFEEPRQKRDLIERFGIPRSTVDRDVRKLQSAGLLEKVAGGYRTTVAGYLAYREAAAAVERFDGLDDARELLDAVPAEEFDVGMLAGADVVTPGLPAPGEPMRRLRSLVDDGSGYVGLSPVVYPEFVRAVRDRVVDGRGRVEVVVTPAVVDHLLSAHPEDLAVALDSDRLALYEADEVPFGLLLSEDATVCLVSYTEQGIGGLIVNDRPAAVDWARETYRRYRSDATPLGPDAAT